MTDFLVRDMLEADLPTLFEIQTDADGQFLAAFTDTSNDREYLRKHFTQIGEEESFAQARQGYVKEIIFRLD